MASESGNHVESSLQSIWAHVLNLPQVPLDQPFLAVGGDSISAMQVVGQCRKEGMSLGVQEVLRSRSVTQLATAVKEVENSSYDHQEYFDEDFDLSPIQSLYFKRPNTHGHFNQSFYLRVARRTNASDFQAAVQQLVKRHSMLRARFSFSAKHGWQQRLTSESACINPQFAMYFMYMMLRRLRFAYCYPRRCCRFLSLSSFRCYIAS
jgi:aryl carrier-like protein